MEKSLELPLYSVFYSTMHLGKLLEAWIAVAHETNNL